MVSSLPSLPELPFVGVTAIAILETIAAANAAYSVIRQACANGREGASIIGAVGKFIAAEEEVKETISRKKNNPILALTGGSEEQWEEFQYQEKLREQRRELESYMRLYCSAGTYERFKAWELEARKQRAAARKAMEIKREERIEVIQITLALLSFVAVSVAGIYYLGVEMGRW